jgi:hypothetical protein
MSLIVKAKGVVFDTPNGFSTEINYYSPFYSELGTQTVGATFPATSKNMAAIGHVDRIDAANNPETDIKAVIADGIFRRTGKMNIASMENGISANIGLDESLMYDKFSNVKLRKLDSYPIYSPGGGLDDIIAQLNNVMNYKVSSDYYVFPILINVSEVNSTEYPEYINEIKKSDSGFVLVSDARTINVASSGSVVSTQVPKGYGISPFLRVGKLIDLIFQNYGITVTENPFNTHFQLKKMVVLNNVVDCIVRGKIDYRDLVPDCTINDFIDSIYCRTGARVFVDGDHKTARVVLLKDIITKKVAEKDWTKMRCGELPIYFSSAEQIKLSANNSFEDCTVKMDSYQDFMDLYETTIGILPESVVPGVLNSSDILTLIPATGKIYKLKEDTNGTKTYTLYSSVHFAWDKETVNITESEISGQDEAMTCRFQTINNVTVLAPYYSAKASNKHTIVTGTIVGEEDTVTTPLSFCFAMGMAKDESLKDLGYYYGSPFCRQLNGSRFKDLDGNEFIYSLMFIGEDGVFNRFFKDWDAILRHSNHYLKGNFNIDRATLLQVKMDDAIKISGQIMTLENIKVTLPMKKNVPSEVKLRTIRLRKPYDLAVEQNLRVIGAANTDENSDNKWEFYSTAVDVYNAWYQAKLAEFKEKYNPPPRSYTLFATYEFASDPASEFTGYSAPSDADVTAGKTITNNYVMTVKYSWRQSYTSPNGIDYDGSETLNYVAGIKAVKR